MKNSGSKEQKRKIFSTKVSIQYRDVDSAGHVNNAVYLHFLEDLRMAFLKKLYGKYDVQDIDFVLAGLEINYHSRSAYRERLVVAMNVAKVGTTSWTFIYRIIEKDTGRLIVDGKSTQVLFDYKNGTKRIIPAWLKNKLKTWL